MDMRMPGTFGPKTSAETGPRMRKAEEIETDIADLRRQKSEFLTLVRNASDVPTTFERARKIGNLPTIMDEVNREEVTLNTAISDINGKLVPLLKEKMLVLNQAVLEGRATIEAVTEVQNELDILTNAPRVEVRKDFEDTERQ